MGPHLSFYIDCGVDNVASTELEQIDTLNTPVGKDEVLRELCMECRKMLHHSKSHIFPQLGGLNRSTVDVV